MTQLMEQIKEKDAQAFTHSGKFHADDVFFVCTSAVCQSGDHDPPRQSGAGGF